MRRFAILLSCVLSFGCRAEAQPRHTVVLELFTSQGCSSCPPADELLHRLRTEPGLTLVPLAYHVDYWDHLGWKDPFSQPQWTDRQRRYAGAIRSTQVYTPQAVINGTEVMVGSAASAVRAAIERQAAIPPQGQLEIVTIERSPKSLTVQLKARPAGDDEIVVTLFENSRGTRVASGENASRSLVNDGVVRWQGVVRQNRCTIPLQSDWRVQELGVAAFLQDRRTLAIHNAAMRMVR